MMISHLECNIRSFYSKPVIYLWNRSTVNSLTNRNIFSIPGSSGQTTDTNITHSYKQIQPLIKKCFNKNIIYLKKIFFTCGKNLTSWASKWHNWAECSISARSNGSGSGNNIRAVRRVDGGEPDSALGRVSDKPEN